jgi:hypothetical protein
MKEYLDDIMFIMAAIGAPAISMWLDSGAEAGYWLQRSGSITVMFAIALEYRQATFSSSERSSSVFMNGVAALQNDSSLPPIRQKLKKIAIYLAIIGTFIWGYGDLPQKYIV